MDDVIIYNHNKVVSQHDIVIHIGDFTMRSTEMAQKYIARLNGTHIFLKGSHDSWMKKMNETYHEIWEKKINGKRIIACHYAMGTWSASHYNSWQLFGHSHGLRTERGKQLDVGVDTHDFYPYSFEQIKEIMNKKEDNINDFK